MCAGNCSISIHSFVDFCNKYLLSTYHVPGTVLGAGSFAFFALLPAWPFSFNPGASVPICRWTTESVLRHRLCFELHIKYLLDANYVFIGNTRLVPHVKNWTLSGSQASCPSPLIHALTYLLINLFIQHIFTEYLPYARCCLSCWRFSREQNKLLAFRKAYI